MSNKTALFDGEQGTKQTVHEYRLVSLNTKASMLDHGAGLTRDIGRNDRSEYVQRAAPLPGRLGVGLEFIHDAQLSAGFQYAIGLCQTLLRARHDRQNQVHDDDIEVFIRIDELGGVHDMTSHITLIALGPGAGAPDHRRGEIGQVYF